MSVQGNASLYDLHDDFQKSPRSDFYIDLHDKSLKQPKKASYANSSLFSSANESFCMPDLTSILSTISALSSPSVITTTQTSTTPTTFLRGQITDEQEMYAQGFLDALDQLHTTCIGDGTREHPTAVAPHDMVRRPAAASHHKPISSGGHHSVIHRHLPSDVNTNSAPVANRPNPTLGAVAPYVTATSLDFIPNINASSQPEASTAYSSCSASHNFTTNSYPPYSGLYGNNSAVDAYGDYSNPPLGSSTAAHMIRGPSAMPTEPMGDIQSVLPADMQTQEHMKEERKKARNRLAASKCRLRRLQRESELQGKVKVLRDHNQELNCEVSDLKEQINSLKRALIQHIKGGCQVIFPEGYELDMS